VERRSATGRRTAGFALCTVGKIDGDRDGLDTRRSWGDGAPFKIHIVGEFQPSPLAIFFHLTLHLQILGSGLQPMK